MNQFRIGVMLGVCGALMATAGCGDSIQPTTGTINVHADFVPNDVETIYITATRTGDPELHTTLTNSGGDVWTGSLNVPPAAGYLVNAYAYDTTTILTPGLVLGDLPRLIFTGTASDVEVMSQLETDVTITLVPYPPPGGPGVNTAPNITNVTHPGMSAIDGVAPLTATAVDPDPGQTLEFSWSATLVSTITAGSGGVGSFTNFIDSGLPVSGMTQSVDYTPPAGFEGTVLIQVTVTDDASVPSSMTRAFHLVISNDLHVDVRFDELPALTMSGGSQHALVPGMSTVIHYTVAASVIPVTGKWTDGDCDGTFDFPTPTLPMAGSDDFVTYTASTTSPSTPGLCELRFTVSELDSLLASESSSASVWFQEGKIVFVTSAAALPAAIGGRAGGDTLCTTLAATGTNLPHPQSGYAAFLSITGGDAIDHIAEGPYVLVDGSPVVTTKADAFQWGLLHTINLNQAGGDVGLSAAVYTGTNPDGTSSGSNCTNWTSNGVGVEVSGGSTGSLTDGWVFGNTLTCNSPARIYCFQNDFSAQ